MIFIFQYLLIFLNLFSISILGQVESNIQYIANTKYGLVQGVRNKNHFEFRKIPFVKPPLGQLRYRSPEQPEPWAGIFDSTKFSDFCIQYNLFWDKVEGVEDCLYLSVFTPKYFKKNDTKSHQFLPVMVNLHPGGFMFGRGSQFRADYLMENQQVVVVVPQYRVGSFGFLSTEDTQSWGNYGLKDQLKALIWVQENIHYFGGDGNLVTIFGTSAGGASVHYHMLSKRSKGLFHRGISSSGCALNPWAFEPNPLKQARKLAQLVNCPFENNKMLVDCLRTKEAGEIAGKHKDFVNFYKDPMTSFAPSIEGSFEDSFISTNPLEILKNAQDISHVPWVIGFTSDEGYEHSAGLIRDPKLLSQLNENWPKIAPITLELVNLPKYLKKEMIERIYSHYFNSSPLTSDSLVNLTIIYSDTTYIMPVIQCALKHSSISKSAVYLYDFNYESEYSFANVKDIPTKGASHMDDLQYLMNSPLFPELRKNSKDKKFGERYLNMIIEFAKNGKIGKFDEKADIWEPLKDMDEKNFKIYQITSESKMQFINLTNLYDRKAFWDIYNPEIEGERDEL